MLGKYPFASVSALIATSAACFELVAVLPVGICPTICGPGGKPGMLGGCPIPSEFGGGPIGGAPPPPPGGCIIKDASALCIDMRNLLTSKMKAEDGCT